ncbi:hypothetical protein Tco_0085550 [Tanacetum coccineum]
MQANCNILSNGDNDGPNPYHPKTKRLYELLHQAGEPLWPGCTKVSQLLLVLRMLNIKSESRMIEKIYDDVMQVLEDALPPDSKLVGSFYETKKFASDLGLPCEKIDCCINRAELSQSPLTLTGEQVIEQIDEFELKEVTEIGGA